MRYSYVAAALVGSVVAAQHKAHAGFHMRRGGYAAHDLCTVYTTVYVTATPSVPVPSPVPETSTSCTEEEQTPIYTPHVPAPTGETPKPSSSAPVVFGSYTPGYPAVPEPSKPAYPGVPESSSIPAYPAVPESSSKPVYPAVPESSTTCTKEKVKSSFVETPTPTPTTPTTTPEVSKPVYPAVPESSSKPAYPDVPELSTTCTEEKVKYSSVETPTPTPTTPATTPEVSKPVYPAVPKSSSKPAYPAVPESSTTCTDEEGKTTTTEAPKPSGPAPSPESSKPAYPPVPEVSKSTYTTVPEPSKPAYPSVPSVSKSTYTTVPEPSKPVYPSVSKSTNTTVPEPSKPAVPEVPEVPKPVPTASVTVSSKEAEKPKPTPSSVKPNPTGSHNNGGHIVTNGDKWAITYTPYAKSGDCKTSDEITADIKKISELGFTTIRSYSTDCGVFEHVIPECQKYGLKVIYGIFLEAGGKGGKGPFSSYANDQLKDITDNAPKDSIAMVIAGNECVFSGNCEANELASYIDHVRDELKSRGFSGVAVTTAETVGAWEEHGAVLCSHIDVFTVQVHPYFTQSVSANEAGDFAAQQLEQAAKVCPEAAAKGSFISEIGWPRAGQSNGKAVAGVEEQKTAMKKIMEKVGSQACLFSFQDDSWKEPGNLNVEQNFGCIDAIVNASSL